MVTAFPGPATVAAGSERIATSACQAVNDAGYMTLRGVLSLRAAEASVVSALARWSPSLASQTSLSTGPHRAGLRTPEEKSSHGVAAARFTPTDTSSNSVAMAALLPPVSSETRDRSCAALNAFAFGFCGVSNSIPTAEAQVETSAVPPTGVVNVPPWMLQVNTPEVSSSASLNTYGMSYAAGA